MRRGDYMKLLINALTKYLAGFVMVALLPGIW